MAADSSAEMMAMSEEKFASARQLVATSTRRQILTARSCGVGESSISVAAHSDTRLNRSMRARTLGELLAALALDQPCARSSRGWSRARGAQSRRHSWRASSSAWTRSTSSTEIGLLVRRIESGKLESRATDAECSSWRSPATEAGVWALLVSLAARSEAMAATSGATSLDGEMPPNQSQMTGPVRVVRRWLDEKWTQTSIKWRTAV